MTPLVFWVLIRMNIPTAEEHVVIMSKYNSGFFILMDHLHHVKWLKRGGMSGVIFFIIGQQKLSGCVPKDICRNAGKGGRLERL